MATWVETLILIGRVHPEPGRTHYDIPDQVEVAALPHYATMTNPIALARSLLGTILQTWRVLGRVDAIWLMGPHPLSLVMTILAALRRKQVIYGIRQDLPVYVRSRHPGKRWIHLAGDVQEHIFRLLARHYPVVVVGPDLAQNYRKSKRLLEIIISLTRDSDIIPIECALNRSYDGELRILSVGRIEKEKNPLMLADVLAKLHASDPRWRMIVCGDGRLMDSLRERFENLGLLDYAELKGHVPADSGLQEIYRTSHMLAHVSWTEGVPQVLFEAFAAGLPVVATNVGGVPAAAGDATILVPPGDADAVVSGLERIAQNDALREELIRRGIKRTRRYTLESESLRVVDFLIDVVRIGQT